MLNQSLDGDFRGPGKQCYYIKTKVNCTAALVGMVAFRPEVVGSAHNNIQSRSM